MQHIDATNRQKSFFSSLLENGATDCISQREIVIYLKPSLEELQRASTLSHELGHAILCGQGFVNPQFVATPEGMKLPPPFISAITAPLASCYLDPLADREARKRGFDPSISLNATVSRTLGTFTGKDVRAQSEQLGPVWGRYVAVTLYCLEKRKHSFDDEKIERPFVSDPEIARMLKDIKNKLKDVRCNSPASCFQAMERLRDAAGLKDILLIVNPSTKVRE